MLSKLFKHEMRSVGRILLPIYGICLALAALFGLTYNLNRDTWLITLLKTLSGIGCGVFLTVAVVATFLIIVVRFYRNLLGREGYLMFTLPVKVSTHITCKTISAALWGMLGTAVGLVSGAFLFLYHGSGSFVSTLNDMGYGLHKFFGTSAWIVILETVVLGILVFAEAALKIYAAIAVGQRSDNHRLGVAFGAYIGFGIIETILANILLTVGGHFTDIGKYDALLHHLNAGTPVQVYSIVFGCIALVTVVLGVIYYVLTQQTLAHHLNLE